MTILLKNKQNHNNNDNLNKTINNDSLTQKYHVKKKNK